MVNVVESFLRQHEHMSTASNLSASGSAHELGTTRNNLPLLLGPHSRSHVSHVHCDRAQLVGHESSVLSAHRHGQGNKVDTLIVDAIACHPRPFQSLSVVWYLSLADSVECPQNARGPNPQMHSIQMYVPHNGCKVLFVHIKTFVVGKSWVTTMASCRPTLSSKSLDQPMLQVSFANFDSCTTSEGNVATHYLQSLPL